MKRLVRPLGSIKNTILMDEWIASDPALKGVVRVEATAQELRIELPDTYTEADVDAKLAAHNPNRPDPVKDELKKDPKNLTDKERLDRIEKVLGLDKPS